MKFFIIIALVLISYIGYGQQIKEVDFSAVEPLLHKKTDSIYVVNFWATWCVPCIKEIPAFEKLNENFKSEKVSILLVSLDFPKKIDQTLIPFVQKRNIKSKVILLNDPDSNSWIDKVDPSWSGAIPGTLIYDKNARKFYEKSFTYEELEKIIKDKLKNRTS